MSVFWFNCIRVILSTSFYFILQAHDEEVTNLRSVFEQRAMEIEQKYEKKMRALRDEQDLRRKTELHEVEERKNAQINTLMRNHEKAFSDIKNYYNDITLNNLALINTLKVSLFAIIHYRHIYNHTAYIETNLRLADGSQ